MSLTSYTSESSVPILSVSTFRFVVIANALQLTKLTITCYMFKINKYLVLCDAIFVKICIEYSRSLRSSMTSGGLL